MKIDDEIKSRFDSPYHRAVVNLYYTYSQFKNLEMAIFKKRHILPQHYNVLRIIKGKHPDPVSPGEIKDVMLDKGVDLTRLVDKLVRLKLVAREVCEVNRRKIDITLTERGLALLEELKPEVIALSNSMSDNLSESEANKLSDLLDKMRG